MTPFRPLPLAAALLLGACGPPPEETATRGDGVRIRRAEDLAPDADPPSGGVLRLAGVSTPVQVVARRGAGFAIESLKEGRALDVERYAVTEGAFGLALAAGETYTPPVPLLRFPMNVGDAWRWAGTMSPPEGGPAVAASARVRTEETKVSVAGTHRPGVRTVVDLEMRTGPEAVRRRLAFEFVRGAGLARREFGEESVREPEAP